MCFQSDSWCRRCLCPSKYTLDEQIGEGGFAFVFQGRKSKFIHCCRPRSPAVAIKVCTVKSNEGTNKSGEKKGASLENLKKEVDTIKLLAGNDHVVNLIEAFRHNPKEYWMVLELMKADFQDLTACSASENEDYPLAWDCALWQVVQGLKYLKTKRVVHCDIKPSNILVSAEGYVKLADFGLSQLIPSDCDKLKVEAAAGSRPFMAPELFILGQQYDYSIDVWSFAWVVYSTLVDGEQYRFHDENNQFGKAEWEAWDISNAKYYASMLSSSFLTPDERKSLETGKQVKVSPKIQKVLDEAGREEAQFYEDFMPWIVAIRSMLVPPAVAGHRLHEKGRLSIEDLTELDCFNSVRNLDESQIILIVKKVLRED